MQLHCVRSEESHCVKKLLDSLEYVPSRRFSLAAVGYRLVCEREHSPCQQVSIAQTARANKSVPQKNWHADFAKL